MTPDQQRGLVEGLCATHGIDWRVLSRDLTLAWDQIEHMASDPLVTIGAHTVNHAARIVICGQISLYNLDKSDIGLRPQPYLLVNSARMQGFIITDYAPRFSEGATQLAQWLADGKLKYAETIVEGFENTPQAFIGLFTGNNLGKQVVKCC